MRSGVSAAAARDAHMQLGYSMFRQDPIKKKRQIHHQHLDSDQIAAASASASASASTSTVSSPFCLLGSTCRQTYSVRNFWLRRQRQRQRRRQRQRQPGPPGVNWCVHRESVHVQPSLVGGVRLPTRRIKNHLPFGPSTKTGFLHPTLLCSVESVWSRSCRRNLLSAPGLANQSRREKRS